MFHHARKPMKLKAAAVIATIALAGCTGANLFSLAAGLSEAGPKVEITAPIGGFTRAVGSGPLSVEGTAEAADGVVTVEYSAVFKATGGAAFVSETQSYSSPTFLNFNEDLNPIGGDTGAVYVIVKATDSSGEMDADTVEITIN